ncbi:glycoside hydrolase family 3 C-terminal domain-containing protein [Arthrobacter sp. ISL-28]|uniref:glycoside hydrolase family 3 C-terminal domain-containing protein n=1 Tax=Arthrobacter sp. ISL-28 TaxID=2819108 RepID=UPI001BEA9B5E|nr:glycoside hydrolase family 3 C-terminal domain-containing protein [Arthrobacter sp. ISL-28]MBT2521752.1 glycoside hydrolase family 3 C-terminal domain-containing protein [Arthrobacter sp. ISL-28]
MTDINQLTLEEKASLTSGGSFWATTAIERADVPAITVVDGPHGVRKPRGQGDHLGLTGSVPATCFPPAVALGSSWDAELAERVGRALGMEAALHDVAVLLGPGINIKRSPLCGRNFEYFSEDPIVSGVMGTAIVRGLQSQGVGASLKHFAANNQETDRLRVSSDVDPRPLREIYLRAFERVVKDAQPWTVMAAYNAINGTFCSQNHWLLTEVLRGEWGFKGLVVSDWGAVNDRVAGVAAGMDLEMPASGGRTNAQIVQAVRDGSLHEAALDAVAQRVLDLVRKAGERPRQTGPLDADAHHALAREAAGRSMVLLKNDGGLLPLAKDARIAVIGEFARTPRYQGGGSSQVNPTRVDCALDAIRAASDREVVFAPGFAFEGSSDEAGLREEAVAAAAAAEVAVVFLGVPLSEESEGFDRTSLDLPPVQNKLLDAVLAANPRTVVVLSNGGVVTLPFAEDAPAILEGWLLGQAGGPATADVLFGAVNPSGRLAETIPLRLEDAPSHGNFPGELRHVRYGEGVLVGYRGYDAANREVAYPFGHGLSYTAFAYGEPTATVQDDGDTLVTVPVTNTGDVAGREVVQVYTSLDSSVVQRAPRELKGFALLDLAPGETAAAEIVLRRSELAYWDVRVDGWVLESGEYLVEAGASSRDIRSSTTVRIEGHPVELPISMDSGVDEVLAHPVAGPLLLDALVEHGLAVDPQALRVLGMFPIGRVDGFPLPYEKALNIIEKVTS